MKKIILILILSIGYLHANANNIDNLLKQYSTKLLNEFKSNQNVFNDHLFIPPNTNKETQDFEYKIIQYTLNSIKHDFGNIESFEISNTHPYLADFGFSKGDINFWKNNNKYIRYKYKAVFEKEKNVWIILDFIKFNNRLFLSKFTIALPANTNKENVKINKLKKEVMTYVQTYQKSLTNQRSQ